MLLFYSVLCQKLTHFDTFFITLSDVLLTTECYLCTVNHNVFVMKKLVFPILLTVLLAACSSDETSIVSPDLTHVRVKDNPSETLEFKGKIGTDFDNALDSLRRLKSFSSAMKIPLDVLFDADNREFYGIVYDRCGTYADVLDSKGNYYLRLWYSAENHDSDWQEELVFIDNKSFSIAGGAASVLYRGRIGDNFDSALDSLTRRYEPQLKMLANEGHYSGEGYAIGKEKLQVDFSYDSRAFWLLTFTDKANIYNLIFVGDVIDDKGNHYVLINPED